MKLTELRMALDLADADFWRHTEMTREGPSVIAEFPQGDSVIRYEKMTAYLDDMGRVVIRLDDPVQLDTARLYRRDEAIVGG